MITMSCRIFGGDFDAAGQATRGLKEQLSRIGVSAATMRRAMIAAYEAEMNVVIHARTGTLWARLDCGKLDLEVADEGPGIPDVELALREGWSTASEKAREMGFGAGMGLPNIRRNSDRFDIETRVGRGTRIRSTIFLTGDAPGAGPCAADAVEIDASRCRKCLRCIVACPTGAIRVHDAGPILRSGLCIGCTECIRECASGVYRIRETENAGDALAAGDAVLVLPVGFLASTGRSSQRSVEEALTALAALGYSEVRFTEEWMEALRAEARIAAARAASGRSGGADSEGPTLPIIPPLCPAVVALVESRFPSLIPHLGPWLPPLEAAGEESPLRPVFLLGPCPAQYASASGASLTGRLTVLTPAGLSAAARAAGTSKAFRPRLRSPRAGASRQPGELAVTGSRHVMRALAEAEAGALGGVTILDLSLCDRGCSGSPLLSPDPFLADLAGQAVQSLLHGAPATDAGVVLRTAAYAARAGMRLHPDMAAAIQALGRIDELTRALPGRDCGACGAPTCGLLAEDIVMGRAEASSCPHASTNEHRSPSMIREMPPTAPGTGPAVAEEVSP
jgi:serine/threonine-protein kinase RsbT